MAHDSRFPAWAWWIIGAITILAISILVFSVVLGIRAGQEQVEIQRRQQIGIALQRATDAQAEGNLQAALDEYQKILVLDPSNDLAQQGIKNLLALASSGEPAAAQPAAGGETAASPLSAPTATADSGGYSRRRADIDACLHAGWVLGRCPACDQGRSLAGSPEQSHPGPTDGSGLPRQRGQR